MTTNEFYESLFQPCHFCTPYRDAVRTISRATGVSDPEMLTLTAWGKEGETRQRIPLYLHGCELHCAHCDNSGKVLSPDGRRMVEELRELSRLDRQRHEQTHPDAIAGENR